MSACSSRTSESRYMLISSSSVISSVMVRSESLLSLLRCEKSIVCMLSSSSGNSEFSGVGDMGIECVSGVAHEDCCRASYDARRFIMSGSY